jgi:hypothetical protein
MVVDVIVVDRTECDFGHTLMMISKTAYGRLNLCLACLALLVSVNTLKLFALCFSSPQQRHLGSSGLGLFIDNKDNLPNVRIPSHAEMSLLDSFCCHRIDRVNQHFEVPGNDRRDNFRLQSLRKF